MIKNIVKILLIVLCFIFPIISIEDIVPWVVALVFIHRSVKIFNKDGSIKNIAINTLYAGGIILIYNVLARVIEAYLVKLLL